MQLDQHFADTMGQLLGPAFPRSLALAVSGGGDSMAMLHLAAGWARVYGVPLRVVTVDHGLRPESGAEAALVADEAAGLGLPHDTLHWRGWDGQGNLQQAARQARLDLITGWMGDTRHVLMAHTRDDQAETVMQRLLRGSGVDGLSGMAALRRLPGARADHVVRPLLQIARADLRHYCKTLRIPFADDPSNDDPGFDRVRVRQAMATLGIAPALLADTADRLARARTALEAQTRTEAARLTQDGTQDAGYLAFDRDGFAGLPAEIQLRLLAAALMQVGAQTYRPRLKPLEAGLQTCLSGGRATLHGCVMAAAGDLLLITREVAATGDPVPTDAIWDGRWQVTGPHSDDLRIAALGDAGLAALDGGRDCGLPRAALLPSPAIWRGETLVAAPLIAQKSVWSAQIVADFTSSWLAH